MQDSSQCWDGGSEKKVGPSPTARESPGNTVWGTACACPQPGCAPDLLIHPTPAQHVVHWVFHSRLCSRKHLICLNLVTFPNPELDTCSNMLLLPILLDPDAQEPEQIFCATPVTSPVGKSPCIQVHGLADNFSALEED